MPVTFSQSDVMRRYLEFEVKSKYNFMPAITTFGKRQVNFQLAVDKYLADNGTIVNILVT